jgi:L-2-hydroxyglutarate oxidase LhgO
MTDQRYDLVVIGGGIVGLATAMQLTLSFPRLRLLLVEKEDRVARHQSGHNSGVIHSGIYYKPGSLKAKLCVEGAAAMVEFCREHNIKHKICGKVIVATAEEEFPRMQTLLERGQANGLTGVRLLSLGQIRELEPHCGGLRGLHVSSTGIADYVGVCEKYAELIGQQGGTVRTSTAVRGLSQRNGETVVETTQGAFSAQHVINCAGLHSDRMSRLTGQKPEVEIVPFRGEYYDLVPEKEYLVKSLIYPVPDPRFPFLGVHFTQPGRLQVDRYQRPGHGGNSELSRILAPGGKILALRGERGLPVAQQSGLRAGAATAGAGSPKCRPSCGRFRGPSPGIATRRLFGG